MGHIIPIMSTDKDYAVVQETGPNHPSLRYTRTTWTAHRLEFDPDLSQPLQCCRNAARSRMSLPQNIFQDWKSGRE